MKESQAINNLKLEHATIIKGMISKEVELEVEKKIDNKFFEINEKVLAVDAKTDKIAEGVTSLTKAILGDDEDKKWGRKSFIERFTILEQKVEYSFKIINDANFDEFKKATAYYKQLEGEDTLGSVKKWQDRDNAMEVLSNKVGARNLVQWISLGISLITLATLIYNFFK